VEQPGAAGAELPGQVRGGGGGSDTQYQESVGVGYF
jgi:hypothetical protein